MRIGIIGAGSVGTAIGRRLAEHGHDIVVSFARSREKVDAAAIAIGGGARAGTTQQAADFGEVVLLAMPWAAALDTVRTLEAALVGKILWDATNPIRADMQGLEIGTTTSAGEAVAALLPGTRVVKAVPPFAEVLASSSTKLGGRRPGVFVCGDDAEARRAVLMLVAQIEADGIDAGALSNARYTEPLGMLLVQLAYVSGMGGRIGSALLRDMPEGEKL